MHDKKPSRADERPCVIAREHGLDQTCRVCEPVQSTEPTRLDLADAERVFAETDSEQETTTNKTNCELCMEAGIEEERARIERILNHGGYMDAVDFLRRYDANGDAAIRGGDDALA